MFKHKWHRLSKDEKDKRRKHASEQATRMTVGMTHDEFMKTNDLFKKSCEKAGIKPTKRQASKFRRGLGLAFAHYKQNEQCQIANL